MLVNKDDINWEELYNVECENCNLQSNKYVYIVIGTDTASFGDCTFISSVFEKEEDAKAYCKIQEQLNEDYEFYIDKRELKTDYDKNQKVVDYYVYYFDTDGDDPEMHNDPETIKRIYDKDLVVEEETLGDVTTVAVYSVNSYEEAKQEALSLREKRLKNQN